MPLFLPSFFINFFLGLRLVLGEFFGLKPRALGLFGWALVWESLEEDFRLRWSQHLYTPLASKYGF